MTGSFIHPIIAIIALFSATNNNGNDRDYAAAIGDLEEAMLAINTDPSAGSAKLRAALEALEAHAPRLASDDEALRLRVLAELALARAQLRVGDEQGARASVDAVLSSLGPELDELDTAALGPSLGELVEARREALAARGRATLRIRCARPCAVYVDERSWPAAADASRREHELELALGTHRLWVEAEDGELPALRTELSLDEREALLTLSYPEAGATPRAPAPRVELAAEGSRSPSLDRNPLAGPRVAPRWVEVGTIVAGSAALVAGAVLWAIDSRCPGGVDPRDVEACPELYDTRAAGIATLSTGAAVLLTGGVLLGVDERRLANGARDRTVSLHWTARF